MLLAKQCLLLGEAVHPAQAVVCRPCVYTAGVANGIKVSKESHWAPEGFPSFYFFCASLQEIE